MRTFVLLLSLTACTTYDKIKESAERNAWAYTEDMGLDVVGLSCNAIPHDWQVPCTLTLANGESKSIQCNYDVAWAPFGQATGCHLVVFARGFSPSDE